MAESTKQAWLTAAEVFDAWRVIPRIVLLGFAGWTIYIFDRTLTWYFTLPSADRTLYTSGVVTGLLSAITGLFTLVVKFYMQTGRNWQPGTVEAVTMTKVSQ